MISEQVKNEELTKEADKAAELFKQKRIENYKLETKGWWESLKNIVPASSEKVEKILSKYQEKVIKLNE